MGYEIGELMKEIKEENLKNKDVSLNFDILDEQVVAATLRLTGQKCLRLIIQWNNN